jgi:hypothetical protein
MFGFEFRWLLENKTLEDRLDRIEAQWPYFLGFGLVSVLQATVLPGMWGYALYPFTFPSVSAFCRLGVLMGGV